MKCDNDENSCVPEKEFANTTSLHGVAFWWNSKSTLQRLFWIVLVLGMFCGLIEQVFERISAYYKFDTITEVSRQFRPQLEFPAVTICNFNRLFYQESREELAAMRLLNRVTYPGLLGNISAINLTALQYYETQPNFSIRDYYTRKGFPFSQYELINCRFGSHYCTSADFKPVLTELGLCYTFNGDPENIRNQTSAGTYAGLSITLNASHWRYTEDPIYGYQEAGIRFQVHSPHEFPDVDGLGFAVGVGSRAYALMSRKDVHNIKFPWGDCYTWLESSLKTQAEYSYDTCLAECFAQKIIDSCGCKHFNLPDFTSHPECSIQQMIHCSTPTLLRIAEQPDSCPCPIPCQFTEFQIQLSYASLPNIRMQQELESPSFPGYIRENYVALDVAFGQMSIIKEVQSKKIEESALLSDIGGQLGLWVGMSLITIVEFLQYLAIRGWKSCWTNKKKETKENTEDNYVETNGL